MTSLRMLSLCIERLCGAGYVYIGMDHFARPDDELAVAQRQGRLHRNFQGYSTHADADLVACGVSAISAVGPSYSQNVKTLDAYYSHLDRNELPVARGIWLSMDDVLRRLIIQRLMCHFELSIPSVEQAYPITFAAYFERELAQLRRLEQDGLLTIEPGMDFRHAARTAADPQYLHGVRPLPAGKARRRAALFAHHLRLR